MKKSSRKFESEVHLGLLVMVFLLLFLNFTSNYIIYRDREAKRSRVSATMNAAAVAATRMVHGVMPPALTEEQKRKLRQQYDLSTIEVLPSQPRDNSPAALRQWLSSVSAYFSPELPPEIRRNILLSSYQTLVQGEKGEYFYVYPIPSQSGKGMIILAMKAPELAFLDNSARILFIIGVVSIGVIAVLYLLVSRFIFSPFRKIKKQAIDAGRVEEPEADDFEVMIEDYRKIIEELKEKEAKLLELNRMIQQKADSLEQFNQYLLSSITSGIITIDKEGRLLSVNRAAAKILGIEPSQYLHQPYTALFEASSELSEEIRRAVEEGRNMEYQEMEIEMPSGTKLALGVSISTVTDDHRQALGASVLMNDLTELHQLQKELETKNRMAALGEMAGGLAHQLRNSMGAITGYSTLLKKRLQKNGIEVGSITALIQEATETERLVEKFLQFARPLALTPERTSLEQLVSQVIEAFRTRAGYDKVEFSFTSKGEETVAEVDTLLIKQVLTNLIENAIHAYEGKPGLVEIALKKCDENISRKQRVTSDICLEVKDYGCGIPEEDLDKIFTPFFSSRPSGTGLGLPLARKIIDLHQGSLTVVSEVGKGTTFTITLPSRIHQTVLS